MPTRTEKEKMLAGELYNCFDPELDKERQQVKKKLLEYNLCDSEDERISMLNEFLGNVGENVLIEPPFRCIYGKNIYIGDHVYFNVSCMIIDNNRVDIGNHVMFGPCVQVYTAAHDLQAESRNQGFEIAKPIFIEDNVWIGGSAILLPGVRIGKNSVIGAGAVVTHDVPENTVVAGNPARPIRKIKE